MSESTTSNEFGMGSTALGESWRELLVAGAIIGVLGLLAILFPLVTGLSLSVALGALLVVGAVVHVAHAFSASAWKGRLWQVGLAVVYAVAGVSLVANPVVGLTTVTILLVAYLLVGGLVEIAMGLGMGSDRNRGWFVASGVIGLLLAGLIWAGFPSSAAWAIGLLVGVNLLTSGLAMIATAVSGRRAAETASSTAKPRGA